jgi:hypothetical protein
MATQPTIKSVATHRGQPVTVLRLATAATLLALAIAGGLMLRQSAGQQGAPPTMATTVTPPATADAGLVVYLVDSPTDHDLVAAITAELNRSRLSRGEHPLTDEVLVRAAPNDSSLSEYTAFLGLWQAGRGQELRVADLRGR